MIGEKYKIWLILYTISWHFKHTKEFTKTKFDKPKYLF